ASAVCDDVERHLLALIEGAQAGALDCADMNEDVLVAVVRLDEAEALLVVEPLHGAHSHLFFLSLTMHARGRRSKIFTSHRPDWSILEKSLKRARPSGTRRSGPVVWPMIDA